MRSFVKIPWILGMFVLISLTSCGPDHSENLEELEKLEGRLGKLQTRYDTLDREKALELNENVASSQRLFKEHFKADSMGEELFRTLDAYKRVTKSLENFGASDQAIQKELQKSEKQLNDLEKDLKNGLYSQKEAKSYLQEEEKVLDRLQDAMKEQEARVKAAFRNYREKPAKLFDLVSLPDSVERPEGGKQ